MEFNHSDESRAADMELNRALPSEPVEKQAQATDPDARAARIRDLAKDAASMQDNFQACLRASTASIMQIEHDLQERAIRALSAGSGELTDVPPVLPTIDALSRLGRQVERYSQLSLKLQSIDEKIQSDKRSLQATALGGFVNDATRRKPRMPSHW